MVRHASRLLVTLGLVLSLESGGRPVFQLGANVRPTILGRLIGLPAARIPFSAIRLLLSR
jgi:hypothetical protein